MEHSIREEPNRSEKFRLFSLQTYSTIAEYLFFHRFEKRGEIVAFEDDFLSVLIISLGKEFLVEIELYIGSLEDF